MIEWQWATFSELSSENIYCIIRARQDVFILEQDCVYPDIDGLDQEALHLIGWSASNVSDSSQNTHKTLKAYLRIIYSNSKVKQASIGRVLVIKEARGQGLGKELVKRAVKKIETDTPTLAISLSAQHYLLTFYEELGFHPISEPYDEDGIQHIDMLKQ